MNSDQFESILDAQIARVRDVLVVKTDEYATEDQLHNFNIVATLRGITSSQAVTGMMAKHTISIYDMIESGKEFSLEKWDEKITDHIIYLILLKATIIDNIESRGV